MKIDTNSIQIQTPPKFFRAAFVIGIISAVVSLLGLCCSKEQFFFSSLTAGFFTLGITLGSLFFVMIHYLAGAKWSVTVRRVSEVMASIVPYIFIPLGIIILLGRHYLFEWTNPEVIATDELIQGKAPYLNMTFFVIRMAIYFIVWTCLSKKLLKASVQEDTAQGEPNNNAAKRMSPIGIILFAITLTFASFDWIMSLDAHWFSTIFGVYVFAGCVLSFFASSILIFRILHHYGYLKGVVTVEHYHDLGKLMFAFVCFWAYMAFSQYMLIWYGNLPEETQFFSHRWVGAWKYPSLALPIFHFALPFVLLMSRLAKRNLKFLTFMAIWVLVIHFVDIHWLVLPNFHHEGFHLSWLDVTTLIAFVGIFIGILGKKLSKQPLIPTNDPYLETSIHHVSR